MPTGYTAPLHDDKDITFEQFVLRCARGMGAAVTQRDESLDSVIRKRKPSLDYHKKGLATARTKQQQAEEWTEKQADNQALIHYTEAMRKFMERQRIDKAIVKRYKAMLDKVKEWNPPTSDHQGLKDFMVRQLEESIDFDSPSDFGKPIAMTGEEFRAVTLAEAKRDIDYHTQAMLDEKQRCREQNKWVEALADSLGVEVE